MKQQVIQNLMDIKEDWPRLYTSFFDKKSTGRSIKNKVKQNQQLAGKLH